MTTGDTIGSSRFHVRRRIGAGSFGVVYEAFDPVRNQVVAVKALRHATPEALYRFKREFRSLTGIAHRNLVRLYELIAEGDQWLVSMELIRGTTFIEHVRRETPVPEAQPDAATPLHPMRADIGRLRVALAQLAGGVNALHNAGKLHRDIKPSNVLIADDRRVVLLDFGLVTDTGSRASEETTGTSGTPAYMSPEQGAGEPLGPATDWYSVGIMLYETLTGQVPFHGTYVDVINQKRAADVPPPSTIASGIPEDIDALCRDMLRRDPRERPSGEEIVQRLGRGMPAAAGTKKETPSIPFLGRDDHLNALREAFDASAAGIQTTVCVHGRSGAGKTALLRVFLERLREEIPDLLVLTGRCYRRETLPYKAVDGVIDAVHRYLWRLQPQELEALLPRDIAAAEQLFPILSEAGDVVRSRLRTGAAVVREPQSVRPRAFAALRELFLRLSDRIPLVIAIDDVQWGDVESAELLNAILQPPDAPALLFLAAYRSEEAAASPFVRALRDAMPTRDLEVGDLSPNEARQLADDLLGNSLSERHGIAAMIADESRGNPFLIGQLARWFALAGDTIGNRTDQKPEAIIREVLQARLRRLESGAVRMLQYVAVNGRPILVPALRRAFRNEDFDETLATLTAQHLVRTRDTARGEAVETDHERIAEAAVAMLAEDELRDMHAVLAMVLEEVPGADAELLARHFRAAGMDDRAAKYVLLAGDHPGPKDGTGREDS